ncbi:MAG: hypothetical protein WAL29_07550 [Bacteroidales bacterium]
MILSRYNKLIFSVFSDNNDYLILTLYINRTRNNYDSFLQIQCTKNDHSGNHLPAFVFNTKIKVVEITSQVITFSGGKIIFMKDTVKIEFASELIMFYLNYTWEHNAYSLIDALEKVSSENKEAVWNSFNFKSYVKGNFVSPNTNAEFNNATGNIDFLKSEISPQKVSGHLWSRLHSKDLDMAYSLVLNGSGKQHSKLSFLNKDNLIEFSDVDYKISNETVSPGSGIKFPGNILLTAKNENYQVSVILHDHVEIAVNELATEATFLVSLMKRLPGLKARSPKTVRLHAIADVSIVNSASGYEFKGIPAICEYPGIEK